MPTDLGSNSASKAQKKRPSIIEKSDELSYINFFKNFYHSIIIIISIYYYFHNRYYYENEETNHRLISAHSICYGPGPLRRAYFIITIFCGRYNHCLHLTDEGTTFQQG